MKKENFGNILLCIAVVFVAACNNQNGTNGNQSVSVSQQHDTIKVQTNNIAADDLSLAAQAIVTKIKLPKIPTHVCTVGELDPTGVNLSTSVIQSAIDNCSKSGGGVVTLPAVESAVYLTGPIELQSYVELNIPHGVVLRASPNRELYAIKEGKWKPVIGAKSGAHDFAITGSGELDGDGKPWWDYYFAHDGKGSPTNRPRMLVLNNNGEVLISGVHIKDSPSFGIVPSNSNNITIKNISITVSEEDAPNTDGIDPSNSHDVFIQHVAMSNSDDNIAIKAGSSGGKSYDIVVNDSVFLSGHGASVGTETSSGVDKVYFENLTFSDTSNGIRIKSYRGVGGEISNIYYTNIKMHNVKDLITLTDYYPKIPASGDPAGKYIKGETPEIHDIYLTNVSGSGTNAGNIVGLPEAVMRNIVLNNVSLTITSDKNLVLRNVGILLNQYNLLAKSKTTAPYTKQENVVISNSGE